MREIVSACSSCWLTRADPPGKFCYPDGVPATVEPGTVLWHYTFCSACGQVTRFEIVGTAVRVAAPDLMED